MMHSIFFPLRWSIRTCQAVWELGQATLAPTLHRCLKEYSSKPNLPFFFFKSVVGSEKEKQNILKDLYSASTNNGFPYATQKLNLQEAVYCPQLWQSYLPRLSGRSKLSMKEIRCFIKKA